MFKRSLLALCVAASMTLAPVQKAQAGILVALLGGGLMGSSSHYPGDLVSQTVVGVVGLSIVGGGLSMIAVGAVTSNPVFIFMAEDGSISQNDLENALDKKYDFIADREVISSLATAIVIKAKNQLPDAEGKMMVSLDEEQVREILAPVELTEKEINKVVLGLK